MIRFVAPIVEGHGDVLAVPKLLGAINPALVPLHPVRFPKNKLVKPEELARAARIARANIRDPDNSLLLLLVDADEDCAKDLGPRMLAELRSVTPGVDCFVSLAIREYESWLIGGISKLSVDAPESQGKPKDLLRQHNGGMYSETVDQPAFTSQIDVALLAQRSPSFRRLHAKLAPSPST